MVRFDQRGCGRSSACDGPFTIAQAIDDTDRVRAHLGFGRWAVAGHSWGAELALRYAARHPDRATTVAYVAGAGAGNSFHDGYDAEWDRRPGPDNLARLAALSAIPAASRTEAEEHEWCLLCWLPDYVPGPGAARHAEALWATRPRGVAMASSGSTWPEPFDAADSSALVS